MGGQGEADPSSRELGAAGTGKPSRKLRKGGPSGAPGALQHSGAKRRDSRSHIAADPISPDEQQVREAAFQAWEWEGKNRKGKNSKIQ